MESRLRAAGPLAVRLLVRRRDECAAVVWIVLGQVMVWTVSPGGDTLLHGTRLWNAAVLAAGGVPLAWRRRAPLGAVVAAVVAQCGTHLLARHGVDFAGFVPMLVLTSSAGWHARGRRSWAALAVALAGLAALEGSEPTMHQPERLLDALWLVVPWALLRALRAREERVRRLAGELAMTEAAQEARRLEVVAAERARIARDLHDIVAHATSVMVIQVGAARMQLAAGRGDVGAQLAAAEETGRQAIAELRRLLDVLRSWPEGGSELGAGESSEAAPERPQPRLDQLPALVDTYRSAGVPVDLRVALPEELPLGLQVSVYRIVQESLTNSLRHGGGRPAAVRITVEDVAAGPGPAVVVVVSDTGDAPLDVPAPRRAGGHGLVGMSERARILGGSLTAGPNRAGGWTVRARLPIASPRSTQRPALGLTPGPTPGLGPARPVPEVPA